MKKKTNKTWCAVHFLGEVAKIGSEKEIKSFCERTNMSKDGKHPIHYATVLTGLEIKVCDKCKGKGRLLTPQPLEGNK